MVSRIKKNNQPHSKKSQELLRTLARSRLLMANFPHWLFLLVALAILIPSAASAPATTIEPPPLTPLLGGSDSPLQQLFHIIEALMGSGDLGNWVNILSGISPSMLPFSATVFIPGGDGGAAVPQDRVIMDPSMFSYHIVPQRLAFSDLGLFPIGARLPTLLPNKSILITNNSLSNFSIDGSPITRPDLYSTEALSVHGIGGILNYTSYGNATTLLKPRPKPQPQPKRAGRPPIVRPTPTGVTLSPPFSSQDEMMDGSASGANTHTTSELFGAILSGLAGIKILNQVHKNH